MNPFDDTLPEEHEPQYQELTTMLQQVSRKPAFVAPDRQARCWQTCEDSLRSQPLNELQVMMT